LAKEPENRQAQIRIPFFEMGAGMKNFKRKAAAGKRRWVAKVKTDSTHPPAGLFTKSAWEIAKSLASKRVSPKGPSSGMRMLTYFINRGGKGLSSNRREVLERAKRLLSQKIKSRKPEGKSAA
jgi:tRNA(adenine34) deaminase